jgi:ribokinase
VPRSGWWRLSAREGLDPTLLVVVDATTDHSVIWIAEDGENAIVSTPDAARRLLPADVAAVESLGAADTLLMQGNILAETIARCLESARRGGARLVVNTALLVPGAELLVPIADVLVVNTGEATELSGATVLEARRKLSSAETPAAS